MTDDVPLDVDALRRQFVGKIFDTRRFRVTPAEIADFARACGETASKYTNPDDPEFQAPPTFASSFHPGRRLPDDFPKIRGLGMDAGKAVASLAPLRPNVDLTGETELHDVYTKTGRSGRMVFFVVRMHVLDPQNREVATADTSIVIRERPGS